MSVRILEPKVRNQIAAGEVVERPGSVVKELLENSLDAGAARVCVELEDGGRRLVRVVDDGRGMNREDLALCVERFATSKLQSSDELPGILTLGFRGEALPSIASVSRLTITSRERQAESAWRLAVEGGAEGEIEPAAGATGTAVEVRDLFYNIPARRKFLKSPRTELNRALRAVSDLALARPDVAFTLENDGRTLLELPVAERLADRVAALMAPDLVENLAEAEADLGSGAKARGLVGLPGENRSNSSDIHVFVGGRPVRDRTVTAAVNQAYTGLLPLRRYPVVFLFMDFPAGDVDVNVHPTKAEVRFARPGEVFKLLERAIRGALSRAELASAEGRGEYGRAGEAAREQPRGAAEAPPSRPAKPARPMARVSRPRFTEKRVPAAGARQESLDLWGGSGLRVPGSGLPGDSVPASAPKPVTRSPERAGSTQTTWRYVGQALDEFLLVERDGGLLVIDQHALHERLLYEELRSARKSGSAPSQGLLVPLTVETGRRHAEVLRAAREELLELGFDIEEFGGTSFLVRAVPAAVKLGDVAGYVAEIAEELAEDQAGSSDQARGERVLATAACKAAVKAGDRLSPAAAEDLVRRALAPRPEGPLHTCPHGRPTSFLLSPDELARRVGRK